MASNFNNKRYQIDKKQISSLPNESGVYFLYQIGNLLVYIGKAKSILRRVLDHDKEKEFTSIGYELTHYSRARTLEKQLISLYISEHGQPPYYNKQR